MLKRAKLVCLTIFAVACIAALLPGSRVIDTAGAFSGGPEAGRTGASGETTCATSGCHTGAAFENSQKFIIEAPDEYEPGATYEIRVRHLGGDSSRRRWGFQLTALTDNNGRAGDLENINGQTQLIEGGPGGSRQYIEHTFVGSFGGQRTSASWTFNWVAPSTDVGSVTLYAAGNQANDDGTSSGDQIFIARATIDPSAPVIVGPPVILNARIQGKKLFVSGENFGRGAEVFMCADCATPVEDGKKLKKFKNDSDNPQTLLTSKKAGKEISPGSTVRLQVRNPDGTLSEVFEFTRE
jgi:hypothetical protein